MTLSDAVYACLRWLGAAAVGIAVVILGAMLRTADPLGIALITLVLVVLPLAIARRWPTAGAWLAAALLAASPFALLMLRDTYDPALIWSHWRCGTGMMALWMMVMPMAQAVMALLAGPVWRGRRWLARAWRPAWLVALAMAGGLLLPGTVRYLQYGEASREAVIDAAQTVAELPPAAANTTVTVNLEGGALQIERTCDAERCELTLRTSERPDRPSTSHTHWGLDSSVTVLSLGRYRILGGTLSHASRPGYHQVFDVEAGRMTDLDVHDVADRFGPPPAVLALLVLALGAVLGSASLQPHGPMVWRRLGARGAPRSDHTEETIALRMMHLAVLVTASLPLLACAWIGLVV